MPDAPSPALPPPARKPLSMLWVLAAVACFVVIHTVTNIAFRKPERAHEPVAEARDRQRRFVQADMKGWTRYAARLAVAAPATAPGDPLASITRAPAPGNLAAALPFDLVGIFTTDPKLHPAPADVTTSGILAGNDELRVLLHFAATARSPGFGEVLAFAKDQHLYLFLQDETRTVLDDPPTPFAPVLELSLPPGVLSTGEWQVSLYAKDAMFAWTIAVAASTPR